MKWPDWPPDIPVPGQAEPVEDGVFGPEVQAAAEGGEREIGDVAVGRNAMERFPHSVGVGWSWHVTGRLTPPARQDIQRSTGIVIA